MSTPPDEAGFLKAVADNPADETARLAYADWLGEHGADRRAAFARLSAEFLRCVRELGQRRGALPPEWANVVDPLFNRVRFVPMSWRHEDGDTIVSAVPVAPGEFLRLGQTLVALDSDRMAFEICAEEPGVVVSVLVKPGDPVSFGHPMLTYLRMPVDFALPSPPAPEPPVPVRQYIQQLELRRDEYRTQPPDQLNRVCERIGAAARMVFGSRAVFAAVRDATTRRGWAPSAPDGNLTGHGRSPVALMRQAGLSAQQIAFEEFEVALETLRVLLNRHGQPASFSEPPEVPADEPREDA